MKKRFISQYKMNKIIDEIASYYPTSLFKETTVKETFAFTKKVQSYITRVSADMARLICKNIKKDLEEYFKEGD